MDTAFRRNLILLLLTSVLFLNVAIFAGAKLLLSPSFLELEQQAVKENLLRATNAIDNDLNDLAALNADWAVWDDTYKFIVDKNPNYLESNLVDSTFLDLNLNTILLLNQHGQLVYGRTMDLVEEEQIALPKGLLDAIQRRFANWSFDQEIAPQQGILILAEGPLLITLGPILTSHEEGPPRGILVMARGLNQEVIQQLAERTALSLEVQLLADKLPHGWQTVPAAQPVVFIDDQNQRQIWGHSLLPDLDNRPALLLTLKMRRDIYLQGKKTIHYFQSGFFLLSLIIGFLLYFLVMTYRAKFSAVEKRFRYAFENSTDGLITIAPDGRVNFFNPTAKNLLELEKSRSIWDSAQGFSGVETFYESIKESLAGLMPKPIELTLHHQEQTSTRHIRAFAAPLRSFDDRQLGAVITLHDITREKSFDLQKSEFIASAAHELNTPLSTIMGYADFLLQQETLTEQQRREYLTLIIEKAERLENIVDDLLLVGKIESGRKIYLEKTTFLLQDCLQELLPAYRQEANDFQIEVRLPSEQLEIVADKSRLVQVFDILLSNAIKYSPAGSLIQIRAEMRPDQVKIWVIDQGIGMHPEQTKRAFDKFYRVDNSSTAIRGLGLGLSIAKNIVETHGGRIWLDSAPQRGTQVFFTLPS